MFTIDEFNEKYVIRKVSETTAEYTLFKNKYNRVDYQLINDHEDQVAYIVYSRESACEIKIIYAHSHNDLTRQLISEFNLTV